jgi:hypothetical protein
VNPVLDVTAPGEPRRGATWPPYAFAVIALIVAALVMFTLRVLLFGGGKALPGTDAGVYYAWEVYTRLALASSRLPHWNPYLFAGTPHLADTQTIVFYPVAMALRWIPALPFTSWMLAVHMWIAGMGTAYLVRQLGVGWEAALAAAVAGALGGSMPAWVHNGHLTLLYTAAWLPWVLALMIVSARRPTMWPHPALVLVMVMQFLAGYLQGNLYIAMAVALLAVWFLFWPLPQVPEPVGMVRTRPLAQLAIAGVLACGVAAFQLWPALLAVANAGRTQGLPPDMAMRWSWTFSDLVKFFTPFAGIDSPTPFRYLGDQTVYVGWVLVILAPLGLLSHTHRRVAAFFTVLAALAMAFAFGDALPFYRLHYWLFPGLRIPGRLLFLVTLSVAILGAIGIDRLTAMLATRRGRFLRTATVRLIVALVIADLAVYASGAVNVVNAGLPPAALQRPPGIGRTLSVCANALTPADMVPAARPSFTGMGSIFLKDYDSFLTVAADEGPLRLRRDLIDHVNITSVVSCSPIDSPGLQPIYEADGVHVYRNDTAWPRAVWGCGGEAVTTRELADLLRYVGYNAQRRIDRAPIVNVRWAASISDDARVALEQRYQLGNATWREGTTWRYTLNNWSPGNVRALLADRGVADTHGIDRFAGEVTEVGNSGERQMLFGSVPCDYEARVHVVAADQLNGDVTTTVEAPVSGVLFFSELNYPERTAYVDDKPVKAIKANIAFTAVPVPAGRHRVELHYEPVTFWRGLGVSAVTLLAWVAATRQWRSPAER